MYSKDYRDILGGAVLIAVGAFAAVYALTSLNIGTAARMGPGMYPAALGFILFSLGLMILVPAFFRSGEAINIDTRSFFVVLASVLAFAIMIAPFGLIPAVTALTIVSSRADSRLSPIGTLVLAAGLSLIASVIFKSLGVQIAIASWPW